MKMMLLKLKYFLTNLFRKRKPIDYTCEQHLTERLMKFAADPAVPGSTCFYGDSITEGTAVNWPDLFESQFSQYRNRASSGSTSYEILRVLANTLMKDTPKAVVIAYGTNDVGNDSGSFIVPNLMKAVELIREASPKCRIVVQSILPVDPYHVPCEIGRRTNAEIKKRNQEIRDFCDAAGCEYLDLWRNFYYGDRNPMTFDGLHIDAAGYALWRSILTSPAVRIIS